MPLTESQDQIVKEVLRRYLSQKESTTKRFLIVVYKDPDAIERLVQANVIESRNNQAFLPKALAFHYCANEETLREAKLSVEVVARVLQELYTEDVEKEKNQFSPYEVETLALKLYPGVRSETVRLGLYLIRDFPEICVGCNMNPEGTECTTVVVYDRIVAVKGLDTLWDDHMRRCDPPSEVKPDSNLADDPNILLSALRRVCADADLEDLLINAPNKKPHKLTVSAAFEAHVGWLLSLFGFSTIVLGEYEQIVAPDTKVQLASVDILAAHQTEKSLLLVACTLKPPKQEDFSNLRHARGIFNRDVFAKKVVKVIPVVVTAALDCPLYHENEGTDDRVPIVDGHGLGELLEVLRDAKKAGIFDFLSNRTAMDPFSGGLGE